MRECVRLPLWSPQIESRLHLASQPYDTDQLSREALCTVVGSPASLGTDYVVVENHEILRFWLGYAEPTKMTSFFSKRGSIMYWSDTRLF